ncbi:hypothetical protein UPYG_G00054230, partial [Umbra pygmaea]
MRAQEGGNTSIDCPYDQGYENFIKYFYKGNWANRVVVIQSQQQQHPSCIENGRYSLCDDRKRRVFTVSIRHLQLQDAGPYWCFIEAWTWDPITEVQLIVDRAPHIPPPPHPKPDPVTFRPVPPTTHPSTTKTMATE